MDNKFPSYALKDSPQVSFELISGGAPNLVLEPTSRERMFSQANLNQKAKNGSHKE